MNEGYKHVSVRHAAGEYVREDVYTNSIEGVFGHFKRSIVGVFHKASDKHISRYLDMFAWRWNAHDVHKGHRVNMLLRSAVGRTSQYKTLIAN